MKFVKSQNEVVARLQSGWELSEFLGEFTLSQGGERVKIQYGICESLIQNRTIVSRENGLYRRRFVLAKPIEGRSEKEMIEFTAPQQKVVDKLRDGWELRIRGKTCWLVPAGRGSDKCISVSPPVFDAISAAGILKFLRHDCGQSVYVIADEY